MDGPEPPPKELIELMEDPHEVELFESFKATSANKLHPGFRQKTLYDDQRAAFMPLPSTLVKSTPRLRKFAKQASSILSVTLSEALRHTELVADLKYKPQGCGWEDVLNCISMAKASYDEKGRSNKARAWSRNADATADVLKSLTCMIPDEKGLSVLRQGLVIIFQVTPQALSRQPLRCFRSLMTDFL